MSKIYTKTIVFIGLCIASLLHGMNTLKSAQFPASLPSLPSPTPLKLLASEISKTSVLLPSGDWAPIRPLFYHPGCYGGGPAIIQRVVRRKITEALLPQAPSPSLAQSDFPDLIEVRKLRSGRLLQAMVVPQDELHNDKQENKRRGCTKERQFPCPDRECTYRATLRTNLTRHIRTQHEQPEKEKPFKCGKCEGLRAFFNRGACASHLWREHKLSKGKSGPYILEIGDEQSSKLSSLLSNKSPSHKKMQEEEDDDDDDDDEEDDDDEDPEWRP